MSQVYAACDILRFYETKTNISNKTVRFETLVLFRCILNGKSILKIIKAY